MNSVNKNNTLIVIPLYNHAGRLRGVVEKALKSNWRVLVVDDGSTDGGLTRIADLTCDTLSLGKNFGKGAAISQGALWAKTNGFEAIITIDADGQLNPDEADLLLHSAQSNWPAIIVGDRLMDQDTVPRSSLFGRKFSNFWVRLECGVGIPDTQCGFRLYPLSVLLDIPLKSLRYDFEVEALVRASWAGFKIVSVPVSVDYPAGDKRISHFHKFKDNFRLTKLHTKLIIRALSPISHHKIIIKSDTAKSVSIMHPIKLIKELCRLHDSAFQIAVAIWCGIFLGALPLIAVHTVAIIYVAHKLHLNKVVAVTASQICAPPVLPVVCVQVGFFLKTGTLLTEFNWQTLVVQIPERIGEWLLGSLIVGPLLGFLVSFMVYLIIYKFREKSGSACDQPRVQ